MGVATFRRAIMRKEGEQSPSDKEEWVCPKCGKVCKGRLGYHNHVKACKG